MEEEKKDKDRRESDTIKAYGQSMQEKDKALTRFSSALLDSNT